MRFVVLPPLVHFPPQNSGDWDQQQPSFRVIFHGPLAFSPIRFSSAAPAQNLIGDVLTRAEGVHNSARFGIVGCCATGKKSAARVARYSLQISAVALSAIRSIGWSGQWLRYVCLTRLSEGGFGFITCAL